MYTYPCKNCTDRHTLCHSTCQKYQEADQTRKRQIAEISSVKKKENDADEFRFKAVQASKKHMKKR